jgi:putative oxidoreductase
VPGQAGAIAGMNAVGAGQVSGMRLGVLILRTVIGVLFMGHGLQKLRGWFGGHGIEGTAQFFEGVGLRPGRTHATAAGVAETTAGTLLVLGFLTPAAQAMLTGVMSMAIDKVHLRNGPWSSEGGYEYNLVLIAAALGITATGPGALSLDEARGIDMNGAGWALTGLGAGIAGAAAINAIAQRQAEQAPPTAAEQPTPEEAAVSTAVPTGATTS